MIYLVGLIVVLLYSIFLYKIWYDNVFIYIKYAQSFTQEEKTKYKLYYRDDIENINCYSIYFKGYFLIPIRFILYNLTIISLFICLKINCFIFKKFKDFENQSKKFSKWNSLIIRIHSKAIILILGFNIRNKLIKTNKTSNKNDRENAKVYVSNHVSWFDDFYYSSQNKIPSFLANHRFKTYKFFGFFCLINQNIFVDRGDSDKKTNSRRKAYEMIKKRANDMTKNIITKPLLIYPEGTTCTCKKILPFKKGAFTTDLPIKMFALDYRQNKIYPEYSMFPRLGSFFLVCTSLQNKLIVNEIDYLLKPMDFKKENNEIDYEKMAKVCRETIANSIGLEMLEVDQVYNIVHDYFLFEKERIALIKIERKQKFIKLKNKIQKNLKLLNLKKNIKLSEIKMNLKSYYLRKKNKILNIKKRIKRKFKKKLF